MSNLCPSRPICDDPAPHLTGAPGRYYTIYSLREQATGKHYVGLTARTLPQRLSAHLSQARRDTVVRSGGLMQALRRMSAAGARFADAWEAKVLTSATEIDHARTLERDWITTLCAATPRGYNLMPGGSSVGGPANALPITIALPDGHRSYASIQDAIADLDRSAQAEGRPVINPATVYFRLAQGWSAAEAFGYVAHDDGRGQRPLFQVGERRYTTLRAAAATTGVSIPTLRSRLQRARKAGTAIAQIGTDRRCSCDRVSPLAIVWPASGERLTAGAFAERTGVAKSTIIHRWHATIRAGMDPARLPPHRLHRLLVTAVERRKLVTLHCPDGRVRRGGERELARWVLGNAALEASRTVRLSESGIQRRLRTLSAVERMCPDRVAWAFGFSGVGEN